MRRDSNALKKDNTPLSGKKTFGYNFDLNLQGMKDYCKAKNCTINDYCSALLSVSLYEYFELEEKRAIAAKEKAYKMPPSINCAVPFSLRQPFATLKDIKMVNDFGSLLVPLKPFKEIDDALPSIKKEFNKLKGSLMPFGVLYSTKISVSLPFLLPKMMLDDLTDKYSIVYSNLNASKTEYFFDGKRNLGHYFVAPGCGKLSTGISLCTVGPRMSLGIFSDEV